MTESHPLRQTAPAAPIHIEMIETLSPADLNDLCDATDAAIESGGGFGWITPPAREVMERYWKGVMVVPERHLIVARTDDVVCGAIQLIEPSRHNEAQAFCANIIACFTAPWARGQGAGRKLMDTAEHLAMEMGYKVVQVDVRETQDHAIALFEKMGYVRWGVNPAYAFVDQQMIRGFYYTKTLAAVG